MHHSCVALVLHITNKYSKSPDIAWNNYNSSIRDEKLYIPPRLFEPDVTTRYFELWKQSMSAQKDAVKHFVKMPRNSRRVTQVYSRKKKITMPLFLLVLL